MQGLRIYTDMVESPALPSERVFCSPGCFLKDFFPSSSDQLRDIHVEGKIMQQGLRHSWNSKTSVCVTSDLCEGLEPCLGKKFSLLKMPVERSSLLIFASEATVHFA